MIVNINLRENKKLNERFIDERTEIEYLEECHENECILN